MAPKHAPTPALLRRHQAAMSIIESIDREERLGLLLAVVAPSDQRLVEFLPLPGDPLPDEPDPEDRQ